MTHSGILVLAEHDEVELQSVTHSVVRAATELPGDITLLLIGQVSEVIIQSARSLTKVSRVWICDSPLEQSATAENVAAYIVEVSRDFEYILAPATTFGKNILPRVAALLDVSQISEIVRILTKDTFVRPIYAGNALATVQSFDPIKVMTVRKTAFEAIPPSLNLALVEKKPMVSDLKLSFFVSREASHSERPELTSARIVIAGGRGLQSGENFTLLEAIADKLSAAIGASRAAVDAGFVANEYQIGQTGKVVAPDLYIAVGISGAIQHLAGMMESKVIVAINKDPDAPIFQVADYGLVGDLFQILPELDRELAIRMGKS